MAQSGVGSYSNPLKKFKYVPERNVCAAIANILRLVFLGEQSGMRWRIPMALVTLLTAKQSERPR
jgi:hypothetical protein